MQQYDDFWMAKMQAIKLTDAQMSYLKGQQLISAVNNDKIKKEYVTYVNELIGKFSRKLKEFLELKKKWKTFDPEQQPEAGKGKD
jgi:hypothetical protein